ncbi:acetyl-CoA synthetase-like protein [Coprinellus micaceus]|uniref:Acetyl-CoA synthetase-like protein n=1 Tax=Coprinellus micaceus TaxID=71717 RepID=A0A4Y7SJB7_COPMI|nr:acetyl-CoA synthetase-like protein [Coprinellus micaceus]
MSAFPCPQGTRSPFSPPPLRDGNLTLPGIYEFHNQRNPNHTLFCWPTDEGTKSLSFSAANRGFNNVARLVTDSVGGPGDSPAVVAIIAVVDQVSYFALISGIIRAGHCAFPISHRNSAVAVADLLRKSNTKALLISNDKQTKDLVHAARDLLHLEEDEGHEVRLIEVPTLDAIFGGTLNDTHLLSLLDVKIIQRNSNALILHSSGSTSFPKPIFLSHGNLIEWGLQPYFGEVDVAGHVLSIHALPLFHAMGIISKCLALTTGVTLSTFKPTSPPQIPTSEIVFKSARSTSSDLLICVPTFLEEWSLDRAKVAELRQMDAIIFGGASLSQSTGDQLHQQGVKLFPIYGATELGGVTQAFLTKPPDAGWEYFKLSPHTSPELVQQEGDEDLFRLFFKASPTHHPAILDCERDGVPVYDTKDILVRHPMEKNLFKIHGRADDQITHPTGEKTNPVPIEALINRHPGVASAVTPPNGQVEGRPPQILIESIWPHIEEANRSSPAHSRIFREMVMVSKSDKPFLYTAKGTPRRQVVIDLYEKEINALYTATSDAHTANPPTTNLGALESCTQIARGIVKQALGASGARLGDADDIFQSGCDSLQAIWIRNELTAILVRSGEDTPAIKSAAANFVYAHPTIASLATYMHGQYTRSLSSGSPKEDDAALAAMHALVSKYSESFRYHRPSAYEPLKECVLLTGSTGALGSYLLESLLLKPEISRIYAINRNHARGGISSRERQMKAFTERGIDSAFLDLNKVVFLDGDLESDRCGVDPDVWEQMKREVTSIMHTDYPGKLAAEGPITDPKVAAGSGYSESKWVAEQVLRRAAEATSFRPVIVRIGQLSGGRNGCWNPSEWFPIIVRSGETMRCLPRSAGMVSWLPVHSAASALTEIRECSEPFLHFVHPAPIPWNDMVELLAEALSIPQVSYGEWLAKLEALASDLSLSDLNSNPALKLLPFYKSVQGLSLPEDAEAFGSPSLSSEKAAALARSLHPPVLQPLDRKDVAAWVGYWKGGKRPRSTWL